MKQRVNGIVYVVAFVLIMVISIVYKLFLNGNLDSMFLRVNSPSETAFIEGTIATEETQIQESIQVYVSGEVNKPGVYEITRGSILNDAIKLAGGLSSKADSRKINLVYVLTENISVYIPAEGEDLIMGSGSPYMGDKDVSDSSGHLIDINRASVEELMKLPGIGQSMAEKIVEYRKDNPFKKIEDIKNVSGIGDAKYSKICDLICV